MAGIGAIIKRGVKRYVGNLTGSTARSSAKKAASSKASANKYSKLSNMGDKALAKVSDKSRRLQNELDEAVAAGNNIKADKIRKKQGLVNSQKENIKSLTDRAKTKKSTSEKWQAKYEKANKAHVKSRRITRGATAVGAAATVYGGKKISDAISKRRAANKAKQAEEDSKKKEPNKLEETAPSSSQEKATRISDSSYREERPTGPRRAGSGAFDSRVPGGRTSTSRSGSRRDQIRSARATKRNNIASGMSRREARHRFKAEKHSIKANSRR